MSAPLHLEPPEEISLLEMSDGTRSRVTHLQNAPRRDAPMSKRKSTIIELKPVSSLDNPHGPNTGKSLVPVRTPEPGGIVEQEAGPLAAATQYTPITEQLAGDYTSRAVGFSIKTWQLSAVVGVAVWLAARILGGHPLLSLASILWLVTGFGLVWAGAFVLDLLLSPSGVALYNARRMWNHLDREQAERWRHWGGYHDE